MQYKTEFRCPICEGPEFEELCTATDFFISKQSFALAKCKSCGFVLTWNPPKGERLASYYNSPNYIPHNKTNRTCFQILYGAARSIMLRKKIQFIEKETTKRNGFLLDYGCGAGYFANYAKSKGWSVTAMDSNSNARKYALDQFSLTVLDENQIKELPSQYYDVISLWHVLEHIEDLSTIWSELDRLLKPTGALVLAVPNIASFDARKYQENWAAYDVPRHLWHFSPSTIQQLGSKHGFCLANRKPMPFDAFYISILSEKIRQSKLPFMKGCITGIQAWFKSLTKIDESSSMTYVFRKKR